MDFAKFSEKGWLSFMKRGDAVLVSSLNGYIVADTEGKVQLMESSWKGVDAESVPRKFDLAEWKANSPFKNEELTGRLTDILDLGFVNVKGKFEPPDESWRALMREEMAAPKQKVSAPRL